MIACSLVAGALLQGVGNPVTEVADASLEAEPHAPAPTPRSRAGIGRLPAALYPLGGRQVGGVRHQQLVPGRRGQHRRHRLPFVVERTRAQRGGQRGVVGEAELGQALPRARP